MAKTSHLGGISEPELADQVFMLWLEACIQLYGVTVRNLRKSDAPAEMYRQCETEFQEVVELSRRLRAEGEPVTVLIVHASLPDNQWFARVYQACRKVSAEVASRPGGERRLRRQVRRQAIARKTARVM
jgi:hypothetical protein